MTVSRSWSRSSVEWLQFIIRRVDNRDSSKTFQAKQNKSSTFNKPRSDIKWTDFMQYIAWNLGASAKNCYWKRKMVQVITRPPRFFFKQIKFFANVFVGGVLTVGPANKLDGGTWLKSSLGSVRAWIIQGALLHIAASRLLSLWMGEVSREWHMIKFANIYDF